MTKRATAFLLALLMVAQVLVPGAARAEKAVLPYPKMDKELVEVGKVDGKDYPKLTNKVILDIQKQATENSRKHLQKKSGATAFNTPYLPGQDIPDKDKPRIVGKVSADFKTIGLDGGVFDWEGVFGKDSNGNPGKAKLVFQQWLNNKETDVSYELEVSKDGTYSWKDWQGQPAKIPLYSKGLEPYTYSVYLDQDVSEKVKLLTYRIAGTPSGGGFEKDPETGLNVANIVIDLSIQQVASTKFVSEWYTGLAENARPPVNGEFDNKIDEYPGYFPFSTKDGGSIIIRNDFVNNSDYEDPGYTEYSSSSLVKTPVVKVTEGIEFADENDEVGSPTYNIDEANKTITTLDGAHKFKYDFTYDVINGGKLTMTEIIPVTFEANGGKFASLDENAEQKIVKEVDYGKDLTDKAEEPTKDRETFKGWSDTKGGTTPVSDDVFKNIKEAKTFYAIWDNNAITAEELEVKESFKDGADYVNDFIPSLDTLKGQVKIKDGNGVLQPLTNDDTFVIVDGSNEYTTDEQLKTYLYEKLQEKDDGNKPSRIETVKAKVTHKSGTTQTVDIPIKVIKNIYEAKTEEGKPNYVPDDYVKVTVDPTTKAVKPQKYFYYVNPEAKVVIPGEDPVGVGDNKFVKWTIGDTEYKLSERHQFNGETTITAQYVSDVIPQDGTEKPDTVPSNFVEVKFVPTDNGTMEGPKTFWVNPEKEVTIPVKDPVGKQYFTFNEWKIGEKADGAAYNPAVAQKFETSTTITATYTEAKNIIPYDPSVPDPMVRPEGYVRVTFAADPGLKLTEQKAYYVKKNAGITLGNKDLVKPAYKEETGYKFKEWDKEDSLVIEATDIVVTAKATELDKVIPKTNDQGQPNEKPKGYKEVNFVIKGEDQAKGSIDGVAKFYVNPNEYVTINPPKTTANTGYKFGTWDKDATIPTVYKDDTTTITGSFNGLKDVIPKTNPDGTENKKPAGYKTVTFVIDPAKGGKIADGEVTVYYVNPEKYVTVPQPKTSPNVGYKFSSWNPDPATPRKYTMDNTEVRGRFKKIGDVIPSTDKDGKPNPKPEGYVTVIFTDGKYGTITSGKKVYYVNPNANVEMSDLTFARNSNRPVVTPDVGYKFNAWLNNNGFVIEDNFVIKENLVATAKYNPLPDVVPKDKPTGGENDKPKSYITVTFKTTDKAGSVEKVVYINPEKAVALEGYAPAVNPITGYEFADWDRPIKEKIQYDNGDVITAQFNAKDDVIPQEKPDGSDKPAGYLTVTFNKGDHGELSGKTVYYVKPNKEVTVPAPTVTPATGYEFKDWDKELTKTFTEDTKITAQYKERDNIIPQKNTDGSDRPDGYFTVTFKSDTNGSLSGTTVVYVKPNTDIDLTNTANTITKNPNVGYTADGGTWTPEIAKKQFTKDETYTFTFKELANVIEKVDENTKKPDGYVTVKVVPTDKATDDTEKTYYVNPTKEVKIPFAKPKGKDVAVDASNPKAFKWNFTKWTSDEVPFRTWTDEIKSKFTNDTTVTANYEKSITDQGTVIADEITVHESFKDGNNWVNNFVDTEATVDQLKGALKVKGNSLPDDATVTFLDDEGNAIEGDALKNALYDKLQEKDDGNKPSRVETLKAKVTFQNGETQTVDIPIKVIKNIYKADTDASKPNYVPDGYVKVTVDPTTKAKDPQKYTYYVNPAAKVVIPGEDPEGTGDNRFVKWTIGDTE